MGSHPSKIKKSFQPNMKSLDFDEYLSEEDVNEIQTWLGPIIEEDEENTETFTKSTEREFLDIEFKLQLSRLNDELSVDWDIIKANCEGTFDVMYSYSPCDFFIS